MINRSQILDVAQIIMCFIINYDQCIKREDHSGNQSLNRIQTMELIYQNKFHNAFQFLEKVRNLPLMILSINISMNLQQKRSSKAPIRV